MNKKKGEDGQELDKGVAGRKGEEEFKLSLVPSPVHAPKEKSTCDVSERDRKREREKERERKKEREKERESNML